MSVEPLPPAKIGVYTRDVGIKKSRLSPGRSFVLAVLAGAFIAFASEGSSMAAFNLLADPTTYGLGRFIAGLVFPTGLMLVVLAGGELFTGNVLLSFAVFERRIGWRTMLKNWSIVYCGNFIGAILIAYMIVQSGQFNSGANLLGGMSIKIAYGKVTLPFIAAFFLGILCNWLVCLAIWISYGAQTTMGKLLGVFFPIWLFITSGFEHSIANIYYIPAGIMAKSNADWALRSGLSAADLEQLTYGAFFINNLVPVTLGNITGGMLFVAMAYWFVYLRPGASSSME